MEIGELPNAVDITNTLISYGAFVFPGYFENHLKSPGISGRYMKDINSIHWKTNKMLFYADLYDLVFCNIILQLHQTKQ